MYPKEQLKKRVTFTDATGAVADPVSVICKVAHLSPGTLITYTYGTSAELTRISTGVYQISVQASLSGEWQIRFEGTNSAGEIVVAETTQQVARDVFYG